MSRWVAKGSDLVFDVRRFGAKGDGTTNDAGALQDAIDAAAAAGGGIVYLPEGIYRVTSRLDVTTSGVFVRGAGRLATTIVQDGALGDVLRFTGSLPAAGAPTASLTANAGWSNTSTGTGATATVGSTTGFAVGDVVLVGDTATIPWTGGQWGTRMAGELQRVKSLTSTVVTFHGRLRGTYTTARSARMYKVSAIADVGISDLTIRNANPLTTTTNLLRFYCCRDVSVSNVSLVEGDSVGLDLAFVHGFDVEGLIVRDLADDGAFGRYGYGVNLGPCESGTVARSRFHRVRHGVTTNGYDGHHGYALNVNVESCIATETTHASFDTHPGSDINFISCIAGQTGDSAFALRSKARLVDCDAGYANIGVYIQGAASNGVEITGLTSRFTEGAAIGFWGDVDSGWPIDTSIISPSISDTKGSAIVIGGAIDGLRLTGASIKRAGNSTTAQSAAIAIVDGANPTGVLITNAEVQKANSAIYIGTGTPGVRVTGTRSRDLWGSSPATIKGVGATAATTLLNDNLDLDLDGNVDQLVPELGVGGFIYTASPGTSSTTATHGIGQLRIVPWMVRRAATVNQIVAEVTSAAEAGGKVRVGIYKDTGAGYPGALVVDGGQVTADTTGFRVATFSSTRLLPGLYWIGLAVQDVVTTQPTLRVNGDWHPPIPLTAASTAAALPSGVVGLQTSGITGAFPSTFPAAGSSASTTIAARLAVRIA